MCTCQVYARVCTAQLRRDALLDRAGLKLGHGVDEGTKWMRKHERRERACTSGWKRGRLKGSETCAEHKRPPRSRVGSKGRRGVNQELMERRRTERGGSVVLDEKAVRQDKPRDRPGSTSLRKDLPG